MTRVHGQLTPHHYHRLRATQRHAILRYIPQFPVIGLHMYLWSVQVHVVGGTDQGVAHLQQSLSQTLKPKSPSVAIFPGYTVIKGVGWTKRGGGGGGVYFTLPRFGVELGLVGWCWLNTTRVCVWGDNLPHPSLPLVYRGWWVAWIWGRPVNPKLASAWVRTPSPTAGHFHSPPVV